jgi:hypothetical protein
MNVAFFVSPSAVLNRRYGVSYATFCIAIS